MSWTPVAGRIEAPGGDLHQLGLGGALVNLGQARVAVAGKWLSS
jgi:hypothetical protein